MGSKKQICNDLSQANLILSSRSQCPGQKRHQRTHPTRALGCERFLVRVLEGFAWDGSRRRIITKRKRKFPTKRNVWSTIFIYTRCFPVAHSCEVCAALHRRWRPNKFPLYDADIGLSLLPSDEEPARPPAVGGADRRSDGWRGGIEGGTDGRTEDLQLPCSVPPIATPPHPLL